MLSFNEILYHLFLLWKQCVDEFLSQLQESNVKKEEKKVMDDFSPCCDNRKAVVDCYKKYPNEPMRCAKEVQEFTQCVDFKRNVLMENRG